MVNHTGSDRALTFLRILTTDFQDFTDRPTQERLDNLTKNCQVFLSEVRLNGLKLPHVIRKNPTQ